MNNPHKFRALIDMGALFFATMSDYSALKSVMTSQMQEHRKLFDE